MFVFLLLTNLFTIQAPSDMNKNGMGLRTGDNNGLAYELSYQRHLNDSKNQRLEFGFGLKDSKELEYLKLVGLYEFISKLTGDYRWYIGTGVGIAAFENSLVKENTGLILAVFGIEHSTPEVPILFSLDFRPEYSFNDEYSTTIDFDMALSIRNQF